MSDVDRRTFTFPEPPSINAMLGYAKAWKGRKYYIEQQRYRDQARESLPNPPGKPWRKWALTGAHFHLWVPRDPLELLAGMKWAVDLLVDEGHLEDDSHCHLVGLCLPTQEVDRKNRGVTFTVERRG